MPLIESDDLLKRFGELLCASIEVDIAVAWARDGAALQTLLNRAYRAKIRIVVGLSGNTTDPAALRRLTEAVNVELRIAPQGRVFHPKFYRFRGEEGTVCWVGSANLTRGGFGGNAELVHEFRDGSDAGGEWFERLWQRLDDDPESEIDRYEARYTAPKTGGYVGGGPARRGSLPRIEHIETWDEFVGALHDLDEYCRRRESKWNVLGKTHSYLHTIRVGGEIARRENWENFSSRDRDILLGRRTGNSGGTWGLLGSLQGAGKVVNAFTPSGRPEDRSLVLEQIQNVVTTEEAGIVEAAKLAVAEITSLERFGLATATRFLALASPGRLIPVNRKSRAGLREFTDINVDSRNPAYLARKYGKLLEKIHGREWCSAPEPANRRDREIWRCRVALVDAFVYLGRIEE